MLAPPVGRAARVAAALAAIAPAAASSGSPRSLASLARACPPADSAYLALAVISPVPVFVGVGALASQVAPNRRLALASRSPCSAVAFAVRVVADTRRGCRLAALGDPARLGRGAARRSRIRGRGAPPAAPQRALVLLALAISIAMRRDIGAGLIRAERQRRAAPPPPDLAAPAGAAQRARRAGRWFVGVGAFALIMGIISDSFSSGLSEKLRGARASSAAGR